jgi:hypothetical protein
VSTDDKPRVPSLLVSDLAIASFSGDIEIDGFGNLTRLDATAVLKDANPDAKAQRFELITAANQGKHIELAVTAQTYEQTKKPNRRYLRLADDQLESAALTWKGQPYLTDHNTWSMKASMGTIMTSKALTVAGGMAFEQKLNAVTKDAVIGILNGTFNKFSIGWWPGDGPILCSVHGTDIMKLDGCNCWPGDKVTLKDGRERVVEFIFTTPRGKETSSVVIPAVQNTSVNDVRAALAAELDIGHRIGRTRVPVSNPEPKETHMLNRLAAAMSLATLGEGNEDAALAAWQALTQRALQAETKLGETQHKLSQCEIALKTATAASAKLQIDSILRSEGYGKGKLRYGRDAETGNRMPSLREARLRRIATEPGGLDALRAELDEMPVVAQVGARAIVDDATQPELTNPDGPDENDGYDSNPYLAGACKQLGIDVKKARELEQELDDRGGY